MENKNERTPEFHLLILIGLGIVARGVWIAYVWFRGFIQVKTHIYGVTLIGALALAMLVRHEIRKWNTKKKTLAKENSILAPEQGAVYCGRDDEGEEVFIKTRQRSVHTQVIGTTNAGKTESVILPWAIQDIRQGRGLILIDGKADKSLLEKIWGYTVKAGREKDFKLFSLSHLDCSYPFNPLIGGTAEEITERVFNAFEFENPYYRALQYEVMGQIMRIIEANGIMPTFERINQLIVDYASTATSSRSGGRYKT